MLSSSSSIQEVRVSNIVTDSRVQRPLNPVRVRELTSNFQLSGVGVICVSKRPDGGYICLDGQHRVAAMVELDLKDKKVTAEVWEGLTLAEEASIFIERNNTVKVKYQDKFSVRLIRQDVVAHEVLKLINYYGMRISSQSDRPNDPVFGAVYTLERIYRSDSGLAALVLKMATEAFGHEGADHRILNSIAAFIKRYGIDNIDVRRLRDKLSQYSGGADKLIKVGQAMKTGFGGSIQSSIGALITQEYNKGKHNENRLPDWR